MSEQQRRDALIHALERWNAARAALDNAPTPDNILKYTKAMIDLHDTIASVMVLDMADCRARTE